MKISKFHNNRRTHNWLIYDIGDKWLENLKGHIKGDIYDLGCGEMLYKEWLLQNGDAYIGVDWSGTLHELRADIIADLNETLPIENDVADTIISLSVMEHLKEPNIFLSEAYRILKSKGAIILQVPFMWGIHEAPYDYFRYTRFGLIYIFEKAGFVEVEVKATTGFWSMWVLKFNYQTKSLIRGPWLIRKPMTFLLRIVWTINQYVAPWLDKRWPGETETAGYFVVAKKA